MLTLGDAPERLRINCYDDTHDCIVRTAHLMVWASKERKGVVQKEARERARSSYPKCEMSKVLGAHSRLALGRHGRDRGSQLCRESFV